ncbi:MAG: GGDEF domain-containing protein [Gammaproteobacteria bacterium]|nr:GGDEF domain-containing protein [Gammaproteobacteria bacterium]
MAMEFPVPSIKTIVWRITLVIALIEAIIMLSMGHFEQYMTKFTIVVFDTIILVCISTPIIYYWIIKPYVIANNTATEKIKHLALHDPLTQLANRRLFEEHLTKRLARFERNGLYGALLLVDMDGFKTINDNYGHQIGDMILVEIANRLRNSVRDEDITARLGGDEFVVLLGELHAELEEAQAEAGEIANRIRNEMKKPVQLEEVYHLGASIGIRLLDEKDTTVERMVREADVAMYQAKKNGKGQVCFFSPDIVKGRKK